MLSSIDEAQFKTFKHVAGLEQQLLTLFEERCRALSVHSISYCDLRSLKYYQCR